MNQINKEKQLAKDLYQLRTFQHNGIELVKLDEDNVARVESMISYDSAYSRTDDHNAAPGIGGKKYGSTAWNMDRLFEALNNNAPNDVLREKLINAIESVDRENSTHLQSDGVGRSEIADRLLKNKKDLVNWLKFPENNHYKIIEIIAKATNPKLINNDKKYKPRENWSFASKFCHYAAFYFFKNESEQDNFSIVDNIVISILNQYLHFYGIKIRKQYTYEEYIRVIDEIIKKSNSNISRNGFDHLIWYFFKSKPKKYIELKKIFRMYK